MKITSTAILLASSAVALPAVIQSTGPPIGHGNHAHGGGILDKRDPPNICKFNSPPRLDYDQKGGVNFVDDKECKCLQMACSLASGSTKEGSRKCINQGYASSPPRGFTGDGDAAFDAIVKKCVNAAND
jgi:hypothetical protein